MIKCNVSETNCFNFITNITDTCNSDYFCYGVINYLNQVFYFLNRTLNEIETTASTSSYIIWKNNYENIITTSTTTPTTTTPTTT